MDTMHCPHCKQELQITPELQGVRVECPSCSKQFTVPTDDSPAEAEQPQGPPQPSSSGQQPATLPDAMGQSHPLPDQTSQGYTGAKVTAPGAVASLVFGILAFIICGLIFGLLAIAKGKQARELCREHPEQYTGAGMALAGTILGWIAFTLNLVFLLFTLIAQFAAAS